MKYPLKHNQGFTAVELLITLFIATAFLMTGYQLYAVAIKASGDSRADGLASNVASDVLQRYKSQATSPCTTPITPSPTPTIPADTALSKTVLTVTYTCPYGTSSSVTKVTVSLKYNTPQKEITHAVYVSP